MPALLVSQDVFPSLSLGVDSHRSHMISPIFDQFPDLLMGVNISDFIGIQPDLLFATEEDTGHRPLLKPQHAHGCGHCSKRNPFLFLTFCLLVHFLINVKITHVIMASRWGVPDRMNLSPAPFVYRPQEACREAMFWLAPWYHARGWTCKCHCTWF